MTETYEVKAPTPGVFYRRPDPDEERFVEEGDYVDAGDTIGLVEVMKQFNDVTIEHAGTVKRFLVENEEDIEAGEVLAEIESD